MKKLVIGYFGSPDFSADFLEKLITDQSIKRLVEVKLVVTQPDRPVGRKQIMTPTPVKKIAIENNINVAVGVANEVALREADGGIHRRASQERSDHERQNLLRSIDLALVYAFAQKIPANLLSLPRFGFWNIHPSLLPKYRGASPTAYPLINGDKKTGVTIIKMDEQIDHGPIIAQKELDILPTDRRPDLEKKLTNLAFEMLKKVFVAKNADSMHMSRVAANRRNNNKLTSLMHVQEDVFKRLKLKPQDHSKATYTKLLKKQDGFIELKKLKELIRNSSSVINNERIHVYNLFKALYPWPGLWTLLRPPNRRASEGQALKRLKITDIDFKDGRLIIKKVQLEGKREVDFATFNQAYRVIGFG